MKTRITTAITLLFLTLSSTSAALDQMAISIKAKSLTTDSIGIRNLTIGTQLFTNRTNMPISSIPDGFDEFKFLASGAIASSPGIEGNIIPAQAGIIYIAIRDGALSENDKNSLIAEEWIKTTYRFTYAASTGLYIYQKTVQAGDTVPIPAIEDFRGAIPIAKKITFKDLDETTTTADPMSIDITAVWSDLYSLLPLQDGQLLLTGTNATWTLNNVPEKYAGFQFLSSPRGINVEGTIKASTKGKVYVMAERALTELTNLGWVQVDTCSYAPSHSRLGIYEKHVQTGEEVSIPALNSWRGTSPLAKDIKLTKIIPADPMHISVEVSLAEENAFSKLTLDDRVRFFTDRSYITSGVPASFKGYEFLSNGGATYERGTIIPSQSGWIYVVAKSGGLAGWTAVENGNFYYSTTTPTELMIYQKKVQAGERIEMPFIQNFQGITPLAKTIDMQVIPNEKEARLESIFINEKPLTGFMRETENYVFHFPYTYDETAKPLVNAKAIGSNAEISIQGVETLTGTDDERTATIRVSSQDRSAVKTYQVTFSILPKLDLFLCIGQSNMAGYAPYDTDADLNIVKEAYLLNADNQFEEASNPMNRYSTVAAAGARSLIGPAYSFSQSITARGEAPVGILVNARGGSAIESWSKDSLNNWYAPTMERVLEAQHWGDFKAVLWHQGEANKNDDLAQYKLAMEKLVSNLRNDLGNDTLLFVAGQIGTFGSNVTGFNEMITTIPTFIPHAGCAGSEGLTNIPGDNNHFDRSGAITLGTRYAQIVADKLYLPDASPIQVETDAGLFGKKTLQQGVDYYLSDRPGRAITNSTFSGFEGYEFLSQEGDVKEESGIIIPEADGYVSLIASQPLVIPGFSPMFGTDLYLSNEDKLCIHRRKAIAGERIEIYKTTDFRGICPVAKQITLIERQPHEDARLASVQIDGVSLLQFDKDKADYLYFLPYTAQTTPEVSAIVHKEGATVESIQPASDISSSNTQDRTTVITVKAPDQTTSLTYQICFEVLPELDLFLCIGQSNMAGAAKMEEGDKNTIDKAFLFNKDKVFEAARNGMNRYANILTATAEYYGLSYAFSKMIVEETNKNIGLVVNARGGSSIELWEKGGSDPGDTLYIKTMERALEAKKWGTYKAVLWHQGEADYLKVKNNGFNYQERLVELAENLRTDLGVNDLLFVAGEISHWRTDNEAVNSILKNIENYLEYSGCASAEGLKNLYGKQTADDGIQADNHFNRESLISLGERYAQLVVDKLYDSQSGINTGYWEENDRIRIYTKDQTIHIESQDEPVSCSVSDITGRLLLNNNIKGSYQIPMQTKGLYIVNISTDQNRYTYKLMIP